MSCQPCATPKLGEHDMRCPGCRVRLATSVLRVQGLRVMVAYLDLWDIRYGAMPDVRAQLRAVVDNERNDRRSA